MVYWREDVWAWAPQLGGWVPAFVYKYSVEEIDAPDFTADDFSRCRWNIFSENCISSMLKSFAQGPGEDGSSLIQEWHASNFAGATAITLLTWPVWTALANVALLVLWIFPDFLPKARNSWYGRLSFGRKMWNRVLSFLVQIGLNWNLTWVGYQQNRANRIREDWDGYEAIKEGYLHYLGFTQGTLTHWDKRDMADEVMTHFLDLVMPIFFFNLLASLLLIVFGSWLLVGPACVWFKGAYNRDDITCEDLTATIIFNWLSI